MEQDMMLVKGVNRTAHTGWQEESASGRASELVSPVGRVERIRRIRRPPAPVPSGRPTPLLAIYCRGCQASWAMAHRRLVNAPVSLRSQLASYSTLSSSSMLHARSSHYCEDRLLDAGMASCISSPCGSGRLISCRLDN